VKIKEVEGGKGKLHRQKFAKVSVLSRISRFVTFVLMIDDIHLCVVGGMQVTSPMCVNGKTAAKSLLDLMNFSVIGARTQVIVND